MYSSHVVTQASWRGGTAHLVKSQALPQPLRKGKAREMGLHFLRESFAPLDTCLRCPDPAFACLRAPLPWVPFRHPENSIGVLGRIGNHSQTAKLAGGLLQQPAH